MYATLQEHFVATHGQPAIIGEYLVLQMDRLEIGVAVQVTVTLQTEAPSRDNAVVLAVTEKGSISLSDGSRFRILAIWDDPDLPRSVQHDVRTTDGFLSIYNKYRIHHRSELTSEDSFTGNAGIVVTGMGSNWREYGCSRGDGPFNPQALRFRVEWHPVVDIRAT